VEWSFDAPAFDFLVLWWRYYPGCSVMSEPVIAPRVTEIIGRGRQAAPISAVQLSADITAAIDAWAGDHQVSRSEAIRRLIELGLKVKSKSPEPKTNVGWTSL
jgi:Ribbon-helix-helix protein, copG family